MDISPYKLYNYLQTVTTQRYNGQTTQEIMCMFIDKLYTWYNGQTMDKLQGNNQHLTNCMKKEKRLTSTHYYIKRRPHVHITT